MDSVLIEGLRCLAHVGVPLAERRRRQPVRIDVELRLDLTSAGRQDRVEATVDYAAVAKEVKKLVRMRQFKLVEAMAEQIAAMILQKFRVKEIRLRIRKFSVPGADSVGVELIRSTSRTTWRFPRTGPR